MLVTAWNNGSSRQTGSGYGLKVRLEDRDKEFRHEWNSVLIMLPNGKKVTVNINKDSFWGRACRELISKDIGAWLIENGFAPWAKGHPPKFSLTNTVLNQFELREVEDI